VGKQQLSLKIGYLMPLVFKVSSIRDTYFWGFFLNNTVYFIEFTKFKSLFLVKFQASILAKSHHLLIKLSCKSACENIDGFSARSEACPLQLILQLTKKSSCPPLWFRFYIYTLLMYTNTRSIEAV